MGILTGREEAIKHVTHTELAFIGILTDYAKGMSTRSLPATVHYTLEFDKYEQIRGPPIENDGPNFHYMLTGIGGFIVDPKTHKLIPAPEPKRFQMGQLYLVLLNEPHQITQLIEITTEDIETLRELALQK